MGQTLTHGVYLPDEGERNCYNGLAANWQLLDGAVGTVADHTAQIAGKAPVAHTHTKSGVTDLLNSNFIPSANDAYDLGSSSYQWNNVYCNSIYSPALINSQEAASPSDSSASAIVALRSIMTYTSGDPAAVARLNFRLTGTGEKSLYPHESNQYSFGLASRVWSNSYIQHGYFTGIQQNDEYSTNTRTNLTLTANRDLAGVSGILVDSFRSNTTQGQAHHILGFEMKENSARYSGCRMHWAYDGNRDKYNFSLCPTKQGTNQPVSFGLGETGYYWDTINNCNPGALSLPGEYSSSVTEYITDKTGGNNAYTAPADGWVGIQASSVTLDSANFIFMGRVSDGPNYYAQNASSPINGYWSNSYHGCIILPVIGGKTYGIRCKCDSVDAKFYKANGNVS